MNRLFEMLRPLSIVRRKTRSRRRHRPSLQVLGGFSAEILEDRTLLSAEALFPAEQFEAGLSPQSVATADFNGDGLTDLATANAGSDDVSVLLGNGDGTFAAAQFYAVGEQPVSMTMGDFDGDGVTDLATANSDSRDVSVLLGNGDGTFAAAQNIAISFSDSERLASVATGDFNGDGATDLVVAVPTGGLSDRLSVLLGNGDGTFAAPQDVLSLGGFTQPAAVATGDFNGDGVTDLATALNFGSGRVSVLLSKRDGTFVGSQHVAVGSLPRSVTTGDFDGDGIIDLATANRNSDDVSVALGNGDGTFAAAQNFAAGSLPISVTTGDFDGDGVTDLATANNGCDSVSVLLGHGDGTFAAAENVVAGARPLAVTTGDFDGDGLTDLLSTNLIPGNITVLLGHGDGTFAAAQGFAVDLSPQSATTGDFNGDGVADLATANAVGSVSILLGNGDGTFAAALDFAVGSQPRSLTTGDFNGDGFADLATSNIGDAVFPGTVSVLLGNGDGTFAAAQHFTVGVIPLSVTRGDFNGDGFTDLATANVGHTFAPDNVSVLLGNGDGTFAAAQNVAAGDGPMFVTTGDFDGDGTTDLVTANVNSSDVSVLLGQGDGTFAAPLNFATNSNPRFVTTGDFNGDGVADLAVASGSANVSVLLGQGDGTFAAAQNFAADATPRSVTTVDIDSDGVTDLVTVNNPSNNVSVLLGQGDGTFGAARNFAAGKSPPFVTAGDFNGDGAIDLAAANSGSNTVSVLLGTPGTVSTNQPPVADAGGPYEINEGGILTLDAAASFDPDGDPLSYLWDVNGDGTFGDATGVNPTLTAAQLAALGIADDGLFNVSVRVNDGSAETDSAPTVLTVNNVAPMIGDATFDIVENAANGRPVGTVTGTDPGDDTLTYSITGGTGVTAFAIDPHTGEITVADSSQLDFETTPVFTLEVTVMDDEGAADTSAVMINLINLASLTGAVFVDVNQNGMYDGNEIGIDGVTVELLDETGAVVATAVTSDGGLYLFEDLDQGAYQIRMVQPTGVDDGAEQLGSLGGSIAGNDLMQVTLQDADGADYNFAEIGQSVGSGDTATIGFWQNMNGQALIEQGGTALAEWLTGNFGNVFGDEFIGADGSDVAAFYKNELFKQEAQTLAGPAQVGAQFMAVALATYFTSSNLAGNVAADYGFHVTDTGIGTKIVNVGSNGAAFDMEDDSDATILQLLLATNVLTDQSDQQAGFALTHDQNGDGLIDSWEATLRSMANEVFSLINEQGDI